eukprot:scaffold67701_cov24-Phaeocystis_antarctica.AAC.1
MGRAWHVRKKKVCSEKTPPNVRLNPYLISYRSTLKVRRARRTPDNHCPHTCNAGLPAHYWHYDTRQRPRLGPHTLRHYALRPQSKEGLGSVCGRPGLPPPPSATLLYLVPSVPSRAEAT